MIFSAPNQDKCLKFLVNIPQTSEYLFYNHFVCLCVGKKLRFLWTYSSLLMFFFLQVNITYHFFMERKKIQGVSHIRINFERP